MIFKGKKRWLLIGFLLASAAYATINWATEFFSGPGIVIAPDPAAVELAEQWKSKHAEVVKVIDLSKVMYEKELAEVYTKWGYDKDELSRHIKIETQLKGTVGWQRAKLQELEGMPMPEQPEPEIITNTVIRDGPCITKGLNIQTHCEAREFSLTGETALRAALFGKSDVQFTVNDKQLGGSTDWQPVDDLEYTIAKPVGPPKWRRSWWGGAVLGSQSGAMAGWSLQRKRWGLMAGGMALADIPAGNVFEGESLHSVSTETEYAAFVMLGRSSGRR